MSLYPKLAYDPAHRLCADQPCSSAPNILIVHPSLPVKSVNELVALAKAKPGTLSFGSGGNGSTAHLSGELFKLLANVNIVHAPFKGAPETALAVQRACSGEHTPGDRHPAQRGDREDRAQRSDARAPARRRQRSTPEEFTSVMKTEVPT